VPDLSVKDQIRKLVELQKIDAEIYDLKIELKEKPAVLEELKIAFEAHKCTLNELEERAKTIQLSRKEKELELKSQEDEIAKANAQLSQIKSNKEYTAKIAEIEHIKADRSQIEEKILLSYDEHDKINGEIEAEKKNVTEKEKEYQAKKKETEDQMKLIEDRVKVLESQGKQAAVGIEPDFLNRYERILEHKEGLAIVPVQGTVCGGCYMNVTPQQLNVIKMKAELVECGACARILYLEDSL